MGKRSCLLFSPILSDRQGSAKDRERQGNSHLGISTVDHADLVPTTPAHHHHEASHTTQRRRPITPSTHAGEASSFTGSPDAVCSALIRRSLSSRGLSQRTVDIITESWKPSTRKQYHSAIRKWLHFCIERSVHPIQASVAQALDYLSELHLGGAEYSTVNTARSALSALLWSTADTSEKFGTHSLVTLFMRGVFNLRPQLLDIRTLGTLIYYFVLLVI